MGNIQILWGYTHYNSFGGQPACQSTQASDECTGARENGTWGTISSTLAPATYLEAAEVVVSVAVRRLVRAGLGLGAAAAVLQELLVLLYDTSIC